MKILPHSLALRPRLVAALAAGILLVLLLPGNWRWATRLLVAWDAGAILYLGLLATTMFTETVEQIRARAERQDEGAFAILVIACLATGANSCRHRASAHRHRRRARPGSRPASRARRRHDPVFMDAAARVLHAALCRRLLPRRQEGALSRFPGEADPDYVDFLYFAYTIGCTSQTSDVGVTTREARGVVLLHSILAFVFNTSILAMAINVGASLVSGGS